MRLNAVFAVTLVNAGIVVMQGFGTSMREDSLGQKLQNDITILVNEFDILVAQFDETFNRIVQEYLVKSTIAQKKANIAPMIQRLVRFHREMIQQALELRSVLIPFLGTGIVDRIIEYYSENRDIIDLGKVTTYLEKKLKSDDFLAENILRVHNYYKSLDDLMVLTDRKGTIIDTTTEVYARFANEENPIIRFGDRLERILRNAANIEAESSTMVWITRQKLQSIKAIYSAGLAGKDVPAQTLDLWNSQIKSTDPKRRYLAISGVRDVLATTHSLLPYEKELRVTLSDYKTRNKRYE